MTTATRSRLLTTLGVLGIAGTLGLVLRGHAQRSDGPSTPASPSAAAAPGPIRYPTWQESRALQALRPLAQRAHGPEARAVYDLTPTAGPPFVVMVRNRVVRRADTIEALRAAMEGRTQSEAGAPSQTPAPGRTPSQRRRQ